MFYPGLKFLNFNTILRTSRKISWFTTLFVIIQL